MNIGITGSRQRPSNYQLMRISLVLTEKFEESQTKQETSMPTFHHGACIGVDEAFAEMAHNIGYYVVEHPPIYTNFKSKTVQQFAHEIRDPKDYIDRNHDIVDETELLIAAPFTSYELIRSGTWSTVRYARSKKKNLLLFFREQ